MERAQQKPLRKFNGGIDHRIRIRWKSNISSSSTAPLEFTANIYIGDSNNRRTILTAERKSCGVPPRLDAGAAFGEVVGKIFESNFGKQPLTQRKST